MADRALEIVSINDPTNFGLRPNILAVGDKIVEVAGRQAVDQLDYHYHASLGEPVSLTVERRDGTMDRVVLPSEAVDGLQIWFRAMDFRRCRCKCPFCFVDQMPKGLRKSLYVKDEDFRLSFLYGNFTTMNDITDAELNKIVEQNNSPQWVSVHVVDSRMREYIFGRPMRRDILDTLRRLAEGGITVNTQAVIVPGRNDGDRLGETIDSLESLHSNIATLGVVPVGLTRHRDGLPDLRTFENDEMAEMLDFLEPFRLRFLGGKRKSRFVFPSDEWYVGAGRGVPATTAYEGFPQLDNGIGTIRTILDEIELDLSSAPSPDRLDDVRIVTGSLGRRVFERYVLPALADGGAQTLPGITEARNYFFGDSVTCSGLLVGRDMLTALASAGEAAALTLIPPNALNHDGVTIDGLSVEDLSREYGAPVLAPESTLLDALWEHRAAVDGEKA